eukprot:15271187-Alexandrium_andersonii.AAC.1
MSASLVGSEMCIRDSPTASSNRRLHLPDCESGRSASSRTSPVAPALKAPVSYTHLTLPTICSV